MMHVLLNGNAVRLESIDAVGIIPCENSTIEIQVGHFQHYLKFKTTDDAKRYLDYLIEKINGKNDATITKPVPVNHEKPIDSKLRHATLDQQHSLYVLRGRLIFGRKVIDDAIRNFLEIGIGDDPRAASHPGTEQDSAT